MKFLLAFLLVGCSTDICYQMPDGTKCGDRLFLGGGKYEYYACASSWRYVDPPSYKEVGCKKGN